MIKTKNQSKIEFFEALQLEYFVAMLRSKIYPSIKKKEYFKRVSDGKIKKFQNISTQLGIQSILEDKDIHDSFRDRIFGTFDTEPKFLYKSKEELEELEVTDKLNYYSHDSEVLFKDKNHLISKGKIKITGMFFKEVLILPDGESELVAVELKNIKRAI